MSRTYKIQKAYIAHHSGDIPYSNDTFRDVGRRYGNQRKNAAMDKRKDRRSAKFKQKRCERKEINQEF